MKEAKKDQRRKNPTPPAGAKATIGYSTGEPYSAHKRGWFYSENPYDLDGYLKNEGPDGHFGPDAT